MMNNNTNTNEDRPFSLFETVPVGVTGNQHGAPGEGDGMVVAGAAPTSSSTPTKVLNLVGQPQLSGTIQQDMGGVVVGSGLVHPSAGSSTKMLNSSSQRSSAQGMSQSNPAVRNSSSSNPMMMTSTGSLSASTSNFLNTGAAGSQANLIVNYIPVEINEEEFKKLFAQFGEVESAKIVTEKSTGYSKGYGFVKFAEASSAHEAMNKLDGYAIYNKKLKVGLAARQQSNSHENAIGSRIVLRDSSTESSRMNSISNPPSGMGTTPGGGTTTNAVMMSSIGSLGSNSLSTNPALGAPPAPLPPGTSAGQPSTVVYMTPTGQPLHPAMQQQQQQQLVYGGSPGTRQQQVIPTVQPQTLVMQPITSGLAYVPATTPTGIPTPQQQQQPLQGAPTVSPAPQMNVLQHQNFGFTGGSTQPPQLVAGGAGGILQPPHFVAATQQQQHPSMMVALPPQHQQQTVITSPTQQQQQQPTILSLGGTTTTTSLPPR